LVTDHLIQKGPAFEQPLNMTIDKAAGHVVVRYKNDHGEEKTEDKHIAARARPPGDLLFSGRTAEPAAG